MARQWVVDFTPDKQADKKTMAYAATGLEVTANQVSLYIGDSVPAYRMTEIFSAWLWLYRGVRERNLLNPGESWPGALLYTGADINRLTTTGRRTESLLATLTATDVFIGLGTAVTTAGDSVMLEAAVKVLAEFALETLKDDDAA